MVGCGRAVHSAGWPDRTRCNSVGCAAVATQRVSAVPVPAPLQVPKNARATPRYLLKIQTEVDAMQQLGGSLDAVFLQAGPLG